MKFLLDMAFPTVVGVFLLTLAIALEHLAAMERFSLKSRIPGVLMILVGGMAGLALVWPISQLWRSLGIAPAVTVPLWTWLEPLGALGYVLQFLTLLLLADFLTYWRHRAEHAWFWPVHAVHHAPTELHAANNIGHPVQLLITFAFVAVPMSLIQIDGPATPLFVGLVVSFLMIYIHSPIDFHFGPLRRVIVDNRFHRIHHSLEPRHFDKNFGIAFSLWDYIFGTAYSPAPGEWPAVGVEDVPAPRNLKQFLLLPLKVRGRQAELPARDAVGSHAPSMQGLAEDEPPQQAELIG